MHLNKQNATYLWGQELQAQKLLAMFLCHQGSQAECYPGHDCSTTNHKESSISQKWC